MSIKGLRGGESVSEAHGLIAQFEIFRIWRAERTNGWLFVPSEEPKSKKKEKAMR